MWCSSAVNRVWRDRLAASFTRARLAGSVPRPCVRFCAFSPEVPPSRGLPSGRLVSFAAIIRYYTPIRHPAAHNERPPVVPRPFRPPATTRSMRQGFSGSHDLCVHMIWSPTPAIRNLLACIAGSCVAFDHSSGLGNRDVTITWPNTHPMHLLSTLSPCRYRSEPKTRYEASG